VPEPSVIWHGLHPGEAESSAMSGIRHNVCVNRLRRRSPKLGHPFVLIQPRAKAGQHRILDNDDIVNVFREEQISLAKYP
jgi:hypothetical protein